MYLENDVFIYMCRIPHFEYSTPFQFHPSVFLGYGYSQGSVYQPQPPREELPPLPPSYTQHA